MHIDHHWFTKTMIAKSVVQTEKTRSNLDNQVFAKEQLFSNVFQQLLQQQEIVAPSQPSRNILPTINSLQQYPLTTDLLFEKSGNNQSLGFHHISSEKIDAELGGKLSGMGEIFVRAGQHYNIDPALLAAIVKHETANGASRAAVEKNNVAGMMGKNGLKSYESVEESIMDMARNLSKNYLGKGLSTITEIGAKYAPVGANNDPKGLNHHWVAGVSKMFQHIRV